MNSDRQPLVIFVRMVFDSMYRALNERMGASVSASGSGPQMVTPPKSRCVPLRISSCGEILIFSKLISGQLTH